MVAQNQDEEAECENYSRESEGSTWVGFKIVQFNYLGDDCITQKQIKVSRIDMLPAKISDTQ